MLDIGWTELLVIGIILIVVVGPKDLPPMLRAFGKMTANLRKMAGEFRSQFDEALRETEMDEVRKTIADAQKLNPSSALRDAINPLRQMGQDVRSDLEKSTRVDKVAPVEKVDLEAQEAIEGVTPAEQPAPVTVPEPAMALPSGPPPVAPAASPAVAAGAASSAVVGEPGEPVRKRAASSKTAAAVPVAEAVKPKRTRAGAVKKVDEKVAPAVPPRKRAAKKVEMPKDKA
jgi:sec-independent protein translocase protein TatB